MGEDPRQESARLREQLHRVHQVCELHRKLGEDTAFENRELKRKGEEAIEKLLVFSRLYRRLRLEASSDDTLELADTALRNLERVLATMTS